MYAVQLKGEGLKNQEVAEKLSIDKRMVSRYIRLYRKGEIKNLENKPRSGRHTKITYKFCSVNKNCYFHNFSKVFEYERNEQL